MLRRELGRSSCGFGDDGQVHLAGRQPRVLLVVIEVPARADEALERVLGLQHAIVEALVELLADRVRNCRNQFRPGRTRRPSLGERQLFRKGCSKHSHIAGIQPRTLRNLLTRSSHRPRMLELMLVRASESRSSNILLVQSIRVAQSIILVIVYHRMALIYELGKSLLRSSLSLFLVLMGNYFDRFLFCDDKFLLLPTLPFEIGLIKDSLHVVQIWSLQEVLEKVAAMLGGGRTDIDGLRERNIPVNFNHFRRLHRSLVLRSWLSLYLFEQW